MKTALLEIKTLSVQYPRTGEASAEILRQLNLQIESGTVTALVGESGCGKSTLGYSILRVLPSPGRIAAGSICFNGIDLLTLPEKDLRRFRWKEVALVFQEPASCLNPLMRIGTQIVEPIKLHLGLDRRQARARAVELLIKAGLEEAERCCSAYPFELSSGMRQRAMIAMALACNPRLLIADEPTAAVDAAHQLEILQLLSNLKQEFGMAMLLISHDIELVSSYADHVAVMHEGRIVEEGEVDSVLRSPKHAHTEGLIAAAKRFNNLEKSNG